MLSILQRCHDAAHLSSCSHWSLFLENSSDFPTPPPPPGCSHSLSLVIISNEMVHSGALSEYSPLSTRLPTSSDHLCTSLDVGAGFRMMDRRAQSILGTYNSAELQEHPLLPPRFSPALLTLQPSRPTPTSEPLFLIFPLSSEPSSQAIHKADYSGSEAFSKSLLNCYPYS